MSTRRVASWALGLALAGSGAAAAQAPAVQAPEAEIHQLFSRQVNDSFRIRVLLPPMIPGEKTRFPVVYLTDTYGGFLVGDDMLRLLMLGDVPRFIAVGIGYPRATNFLQAGSIRTRDLTHVAVKSEGAGFGFPIAGLLKPPVPNGEAAKFLAFIRQELMPFIDARYPTDPADRAYFGDSLGGLFGCYVMFTAPETFNRYIIGSPSIWWADDDVYQLAERYTKSHDDLKAKVFMGIGGLEELPPAARAKMVTNMLRMERLLRGRNYPGLELTARIFPDETHITVVPMNLVRGLVSVFGPPAPEQTIAAKYAEMTRSGRQ